MNSSCLIPVTVGGLLALFSLREVKDRETIVPQSALKPAVVRILETRRATPTAHVTTPYGWSSVESLLDQNPEEFRKLINREIETCALALEGMVRRANLGALESRGYLHTRLQALREHVEYARGELAKLPSSVGEEDFIPAHAHFYQTMKSLEQAFAQATTELNGDI